MTNETGGPAYPTKDLPYSRDDKAGMTLRDYFAAKALQGMCANPQSDGSPGPDVWAQASYQLADAMLKARK